MARYDLEQLMAEIQALLAANFNTKVAAISTEKADSMVMKTVASGAYFTTMNFKQANYNPFILYGIEDIQSDSTESASIRTVTIQVALILTDSGDDTDVKMQARMLRYLRALEEVFQDSYQLAESGVKLKIQSLRPDTFAYANSTELARVVGVNLTAVFA
jgi:hypothetical protein